MDRAYYGTTASIYQLDDDPETYGLRAAWFILVSPDGEYEIAGPWATTAEATAYAEHYHLTLEPLD